MPRTRDPRIPADLLGRAYPTGSDAASRKKRLKSYALEALVLPAGVVILELYLAFYRSWDSDAYQVNVPLLIGSFLGVYIVYFALNYLYSEHKVKKYAAWREQTFHNEESTK